jgi:hypothetical protein
LGEACLAPTKIRDPILTANAYESLLRQHRKRLV